MNLSRNKLVLITSTCIRHNLRVHKNNKICDLNFSFSSNENLLIELSRGKRQATWRTQITQAARGRAQFFVDQKPSI